MTKTARRGKYPDWNTAMDAQMHIGGYRSFVRFLVGGGAIIIVLLAFMAAFLT